MGRDRAGCVRERKRDRERESCMCAACNMSSHSRHCAVALWQRLRKTDDVVRYTEKKKAALEISYNELELSMLKMYTFYKYDLLKMGIKLS